MTVTTEPTRDTTRHHSPPSVTRLVIGSVVGVAILAAFPLVAPGYWVYFVGLLAINVVATVGLDLIVGYTGLLSMGHAAFLGVGAYTVAVLQTRWGLPIWVTLPAAGVVAAIFGVGFGLPSLRIRGLYLVIATLAAQFILNFAFVHWDSVTNGDVGLVVQPASVFGVLLNNEVRIYYLVLPVAAFAIWFARNVVDSRVGRAFIAVRERDLTAEVLGIHAMRYKLYAFALGSFYAGVAGGLMAYFFRLVNPEQFGITLSVFFLSAVIVGGMGSTFGALLGATFMTILPEALREAVESVAGVLQIDVTAVLVPLREVIFGFLMVAFLIFEPHGLARIWRRAASLLRSRTKSP